MSNENEIRMNKISLNDCQLYSWNFSIWKDFKKKNLKDSGEGHKDMKFITYLNMMESNGALPLILLSHRCNEVNMMTLMFADLEQFWVITFKSPRNKEDEKNAIYKILSWWENGPTNLSSFEVFTWLTMNDSEKKRVGIIINWCLASLLQSSPSGIVPINLDLFHSLAKNKSLPYFNTFSGKEQAKQKHEN